MKAKPLEVSFAPVDNARLANLCGALDANLKQIETAFDVSVARRGETFSIHGAPERSERAAQALRRFYDSAAALSPQEVQMGLIEIAQETDQTPDDQVVLLSKRGELRGRTKNQAEYMRNIRAHDITFAIGPAGTGKTYLAVASAVDAFERESVKRIVLVRPAVEAGEKLGFLPGDLAQKVDPYLRPLYDALYDLLGYDRVTKMFERNQIEIAPLAYMRGRTLNQSFIILDEAQNTTPEQMKMFLTRIGFGTKAVVTGDVTQIDLARHMKSGLIDAREVLQNVRGIAFTLFDSSDVVRHPVVQQIINAYARQSESQ